ncbi:ATP-binding cassette domain-containing protein [Azospirillum sp. RWY-5-1]|uniref:ATP-binding cassette domain-containing protein n=2 Tax=Azospirillum oleiclasticum TaxID=2735135 RepID=A0ABX2TJ17_9PROT|nr:ATP-binding cassette domain-containing protein [Azospirillum oleiclasticum]NYZ14481.1 ATP-binding cassette domain-containing protein [Azospirillum oleiclasticum]NYZ23167.1 ATP-binding cassette domain-containing protein [Azospirillum oleiclasticum]
MLGEHLIIDVRSKRFPARGGTPARTVLKDLRLELTPGRFHAIIGPSGCGKTTLLNLVAGLDRDFGGGVTLPGGRRAVLGYVFQNPRLLPWRTVAENIELVLHDKADARERAARWLREVGMEEHGAAYPQRLSVGMSRRVALARAFAVEPDLLLMDEPFVSLDEPTARNLRDLLVRIRRTHAATVLPATVLFVTHDLREAVTLADRVLFLSRPPARVLLDLPIDLTPEERLDERRVDALRADLRHDHATTLEGVS